MTDRPARIMRAATLLAFVVAAALMVRALLMAGGQGDEVIDQQASTGEVSPAGAINLNIAPDQELVVRGYPFVYEESESFRLCTGRTGDDPPRCIGPYLDIVGLDPASVPLERERDEKRKVTVHHGDAIAVIGTIEGTQFRVQSVVR